MTSRADTPDVFPSHSRLAFFRPIRGSRLRRVRDSRERIFRCFHLLARRRFPPKLFERFQSDTPVGFCILLTPWVSLAQSVKEIMVARIKKAARSGCDAVEPDKISVSFTEKSLKNNGACCCWSYTKQTTGNGCQPTIGRSKIFVQVRVLGQGYKQPGVHERTTATRFLLCLNP